MLEVSVVNKLPDNKVLISEKSQTAKQTLNQRYYVANEDNADKFIKQRKNVEQCNGFQKFCSPVLALCSGIVIGSEMKIGGWIGKTLAGLAAGIGVFHCCNVFDKAVNKMAEQNNMKHFNVEEITADEEKVEELLNYKEEQPAVEDAED